MTTPPPRRRRPDPDRAGGGRVVDGLRLAGLAADGTAGGQAIGRLRRVGLAADRAAGGLAADLALYLGSAMFAALTAIASTLAPHRYWGWLALPGYALATLVVVAQLALRSRRPSLAGPVARAWLMVATWAATAVVPLVAEAVQRAGGRSDRAQEEVLVVEQGGSRLLDAGTPYLSRAAIAALPPDQQLLGYLPYQPGMALFGLPRALVGASWPADARLWFALVTAAALATAVHLLHRRKAGVTLIRAVQVVTVLPLCALTLATGGDDLPVLALCLLALAFAVRAGRSPRGWLAVGGCIGLAAAMKAFALPVLAVLFLFALRRGGRAGLGYALPALGLPALALLPALLIDAGAVVENVVRFPLGRGLVTSPAASPLPGHLLTTGVPGGRAVAAALLVGTGLLIAVDLARRPPVSAAHAALVCGYGLTAAIMLMPATRFGYLLYPAGFTMWVPALARAAPPGRGPAGGGAVDRPGTDPVPISSRAPARRRTQGE